MNNAIVRIDNENPTFTTMQLGTTAEKKAFFNATQNPAFKVSEFINQNITIANVFMQKTTYVDDEGVVTDGIKSIIITPEGDGILANSNGIAKSLMSLFEIFGLPSEWDEPLTCTVRQVETPKGRYFKLEVV